MNNWRAPSLTRANTPRERHASRMYAPLALLFPCAVPTALPTIFYLEHGHEHVPAEAHGSLRGAKVEKVAAVPPSQLADTLVGFPPGHVATKWEEMGRGFRELARLVSHLEALRQASASLPPDANPTQPEAIGMIMDRPSFAFEKYWGTGANFRLADWIAAAPLDWQVMHRMNIPADPLGVDAKSERTLERSRCCSCLSFPPTASGRPLTLCPSSCRPRPRGSGGWVLPACTATCSERPSRGAPPTLSHSRPQLATPSCSASSPSSPSPPSLPLAAAT